MNNTVIYIDDQPIDLKPKSVIALSIKKIDIGELGERFLNFSNTINIPLTETNERAFGLASNQNINSALPYTLQNAKVVQNGFEIIKDANVFLKKKNKKKEFELNIYENSINLFQSIKGLTLKELACITNSGWLASDIDSARLNTSGIISAIVYWDAAASTIYDSDIFLPSFFYHTFITSILEFTGLTISGAILTDTRFTDLVVPFPGEAFEYPEDSLVQNYQSSDSFQFFSVLNTDTILLFSYTNNLDYNIQIDLTSNANASALTLNDGTYLRFVIRKNTVEVTHFDVTGTGVTVSATPIIILAPGDVVDLIATSDAPTTGVDATMELVVFNVDQRSFVDRTLVNWNLLLGDVPCEDLLNDFFVRFCIIHKQIGKTLHLKMMQDIINDRASSVDWSGKLLSDETEIDFTSEYAQNNYFQYEESEDVIQVNKQNLGRGNISNTNTAFDLAKTIFTSPFQNTVTIQPGNFNVAHIPVYIDDTVSIFDFENEPGLRLLTLKSRLLSHGGQPEPGIIFDSLLRIDYKMGYFVDASASKDTGFQYFLNQFYVWLQKSTQKPKLLKKMFLLTEQDIAGYDPFKQVYDGLGYYIVNKIHNYIGKITEVELFKVS